MSDKHIAVRNVAANWIGAAFTMMAGFFLMPYTVHKLGDAVYGLWMLLSLFTGNFGVLDLGVRDAVGRYIAFHRAQGQPEEVNSILSTAMVLLLAAAGVAFLIFLVTQFLFYRVFQVPPGTETMARLAFLAIGLNMALRFPLSVFDATLWANQRFDQINAVNIVTDLLRAGAMFLTLWLGYGLVMLTVLTLASAIVNAALKAVLSFRQNPEMVIHPRFFRRKSVRELFSFGLSSFMNAMGSRLSSFLTAAFAGHYLMLAAVTGLSIAQRLCDYATQFVSDAAAVLTPIATKFHARNDLALQQNLAVTAGRYMYALSLYFFIGFVFLGGPLIVRWMGPSYGHLHTILVILSAGALYGAAQNVSTNIILSMAKHRILAYVRVAAALLLIGTSYMLLQYGLTGLAVAKAVFIGAFLPTVGVIYACHLLHLPLWSYFIRTLVRPTLTALVPAVILWGLVTLHRPTTWASILLMGAAYSVVYAAACVHLVGFRQSAELVRGVLGRRAEVGESA